MLHPQVLAVVAQSCTSMAMTCMKERMRQRWSRKPHQLARLLTEHQASSTAQPVAMAQLVALQERQAF